MALTVNGSQIRYGAFLTAFVSFLLLAFTIMLLVQAVRRYRTGGGRRSKQPRVRSLQQLHPGRRLGLHVLQPRRRSHCLLTPTGCSARGICQHAL
jgi:hypothetical protein